jgi:hypothetical protein
MNIRDVHLHKRDINSHQCVSYRYTGMRVSTSVNDDRIDVSSRFMNAVDYGAFAVGLEGY